MMSGQVQHAGGGRAASAGTWVVVLAGCVVAITLFYVIALDTRVRVATTSLAVQSLLSSANANDHLSIHPVLGDQLILPADLNSSYWYMGLPHLHEIMEKKIPIPFVRHMPFVWGAIPRVLKGLSHPRIIEGSPVKAGLHMKLDTIAYDKPLYNPAVVAIPSNSKLSSLARFLGVARATRYWKGGVGRAADGYLWRNSLVLEDKNVPQAKGVHAQAELLFLDDDFQIVAQSPIQSSSSTLDVGHGYEDPRLFYFRGGQDLFIYTADYNHGREARYPLQDSLGSLLRPLQLFVGQGGKGRHVTVEAQYGGYGMSDFTPLSDLCLALEEGNCPPAPVIDNDGETNAAGDGGGPPRYYSLDHRPLQGKNQVFFEDQQGQNIYVINRFYPLEIYRIVNNETLAVVQVTQKPQLSKLGDYNWYPDEHSEYHLNGGKMLWIKEIQQWLGVAHYHLYDKEEDSQVGHRWYFHVFFTMTASEPFEVSALSPEFCFSSIHRPDDCDRIQFITTLERVGDVIVIPYGRNDLESMVYTTTVAEVLSMLRPLGGLSPDEDVEWR